MQDINQRINSLEFKLSQKIFARRINLNISRKQAAKLANLDLVIQCRKPPHFNAGI